MYVRLADQEIQLRI